MEILIMVIHICFLLIMPPFKVWTPKERNTQCPLLFVESPLLLKGSGVAMFLPASTLLSIEK